MIDAQALVAAQEKAIQDGTLIEQPSAQDGQLSGSAGAMKASPSLSAKEPPAAGYARAPAGSSSMETGARPPAVQKTTR